MGKIYNVVSIGSTNEAAAGIPEAPIDGQQHARQDADWTPVTAASIGAVPFFGQIPAGTNLNSLIEPGYWFNPVNPALELNYPSNFAGTLQVLPGAGVTQIYTEFEDANNSHPRQYRRGFYTYAVDADDIWGGWAQVYDSNNPPPASGGDGLDHDWTDIAVISGAGGWGKTSFKCARKNGVVTVMSDGVFANTMNTAAFAILPDWAWPGIQISAPAIAANVGIPTTVSITANGQMNIPYIGSVPNTTEIIFTVSYIGAPPANSK